MHRLKSAASNEQERVSPDYRHHLKDAAHVCAFASVCSSRILYNCRPRDAAVSRSHTGRAAESGGIPSWEGASDACAVAVLAGDSLTVSVAVGSGLSFPAARVCGASSRCSSPRAATSSCARSGASVRTCCWRSVPMPTGCWPITCGRNAAESGPRQMMLVHTAVSASQAQSGHNPWSLSRNKEASLCD